MYTYKKTPNYTTNEVDNVNSGDYYMTIIKRLKYLTYMKCV